MPRRFKPPSEREAREQVDALLKHYGFSDKLLREAFHLAAIDGTIRIHLPSKKPNTGGAPKRFDEAVLRAKLLEFVTSPKDDEWRQARDIPKGNPKHWTGEHLFNFYHFASTGELFERSHEELAADLGMSLGTFRRRYEMAKRLIWLLTIDLLAEMRAARVQKQKDHSF
jgi:hypothetical protein